MPHTAVNLIDRAATLGFDALAITLHDSQFVDPGVTAYARERGITLIPGIERTIQHRHVLLLNFPSAAVESGRELLTLSYVYVAGATLLSSEVFDSARMSDI